MRKIYGPSFAQGQSDEAKPSDVLGELNELTSFGSIKTDVANAGAKWEDSEVVVDQGVITSCNPGDLEAFSAKIIEEVKEGRPTQRNAA